MRKNYYRPPMEDDQEAPLDTTDIVGYVLAFVVVAYFIRLVGIIVIKFFWR